MATSLDDIRVEYERSLADAYACGPVARRQAWDRLATLIDAYAASQFAPNMAEDATDVADHATPRRKTTPRKARP
jgi:hypothetical protein